MLAGWQMFDLPEVCAIILSIRNDITALLPYIIYFNSYAQFGFRSVNSFGLFIWQIHLNKYRQLSRFRSFSSPKSSYCIDIIQSLVCYKGFIEIFSLRNDCEFVRSDCVE